MRKALVSFILIALVSLPAFAWGRVPQSSMWKSYSVTNSGSLYTTTAVSNSIIPAGSAILGWSMVGIVGATHEMVVTIYDGPATQWDEILDEAEVVDFTRGGEWFPYPKTLEDQIYIHQGPGTIVTIYFE